MAIPDITLETCIVYAIYIYTGVTGMLTRRCNKSFYDDANSQYSRLEKQI